MCHIPWISPRIHSLELSDPPCHRQRRQQQDGAYRYYGLRVQHRITRSMCATQKARTSATCCFL